MAYTIHIVFVLTVLLNVDLFHGAPTAERLVCEEQPRDLFLVVDDSASIGGRDIKKVRKFLAKLVASVHVSRDMTRIGFLQFSDEENTAIRFNLDNDLDSETIHHTFKNMEYYGGRRTRTDLALKIVADQVFTKTGGDRPKVPDIAVVFTDGSSRYPDLTAEQAKRLKGKGVRVIAIGAGEKVGNMPEKLKRELLTIASSPEDMKIVDFANLESIVVDIVNKVCRPVTTPKPPTTPTELKPQTEKPTTKLRAPNWVGQQPTTATEVTTRPTTATEVSTTSEPLGCPGSEGKDVLFLVDGTVNFQQSYDLSEKYFRKVKGFIKSVVRDINDERFRVGVMQYTDKGTAKMEIDFMNPKEYREIKVRLGTIVQLRGYKRFTGDALVAANQQFYELDALKMRERNPNVIVLITRGIPNDKEHAMSEAGFLEFRKVRLITVGVRSAPSAKYFASFLNEMVYPSNVILSRYKGLKRQRVQAMDMICSEFQKTVNPAKALSASQCRRDPQDIYFVIDGSASIKNSNFGKVQIFLMDFISLLRVESSNIHTGLIQYSEQSLTSVVWNLGAYTEFETMINLRNMQYQSGKRTHTGDALTRVNNEVFTGLHGDRPHIPNMLIIFTDGNAHDLRVAREQAKILKEEKGVLIITIGAGTKATLRKFKQELIDMASGPEYAMTVNFDELEFFAQKAFPLVCRGLMRRL